jgi:hypothetical protein
MNLVVSDALAKEILRLGRSDAKLLRALAADWIDRIDPAALYPFLLGDGIAVDLLAQRLKKDPDRTLAALERIEGGKHVAGPGRRGPKAAKKYKAAKAPKAAKVALRRAGKGKRVRLSKPQVEKLKAAVVAFLGSHPWTTRKAISEAARIPTPSLYNRLIAELRADKRLVSKGEKAMRVYALAGAAHAKGAEATKPAKPGKKAAKKAGKVGRPRKAGKKS